MYRCFYIVNDGDDIAGFEYAGTDESGYLIKEPEDNGLQRNIGTTLAILAHSQAVNMAPNKELELYGYKIVDVYATDSRVVFSCKEYDTGSTYVSFGGMAIGVAMTAISSARAKKRIQGTTLVGHIRYEWLGLIEYHVATSKRDTNSVALTYIDTDDIMWITSFALSDSLDPRPVAEDIARKACRYKLAMKDEKTAEERALLLDYCHGKQFPIISEPGSMMSDELPSYPAPLAEQFRPGLEAAVVYEPLAIPSAPAFCRNCGLNLQAYPVSAKFCPKCGVKI